MSSTDALLSKTTKAEGFERLGQWAVIKNDDVGIDRRKCERIVPMEVLSLGFPCTGTLDMQAALSTLGYANPYHAASLFENSNDMLLWIKGLRTKLRGRTTMKKEDFDKLLGHCGAVTDAPCVCCWKELHEAYSKAKVILLEIDEDEWYQSCEFLVDGILKESFGRVVLWMLDPRWFMRVLMCASRCVQVLLGSTSRTKAKSNALAAYRAHYSEVRKTIPSDQLIDYRLGSGWEPLCAFLRKDIPTVPFPCRDDTSTLPLVFREVRKRAIWNAIFYVIALVLIQIFIAMIPKLSFGRGKG